MKLHSQPNFPERKTKTKPSQKRIEVQNESLYRKKTASLHASLDRGHPEPCSKGSGSASCHSNSFWSWVAGSLMTSLDSSEDEDVSGSFGGWEGCFFRSVCLFCGAFLSCVCRFVCFHLGKRNSRICGNLIFYVPYLLPSSCVRDSNQVVETIL